MIAKSFDAINIGTEYIADARYLDRKDALRKLLEKAPTTLQYVPFRLDLEQAFAEVKQQEEEGLVIKDVNSRYIETLNPNKRGFDWMKIRNWRPPETCSVVGFTPGENARSAFFGSLVLEREGKFRGCVGTGFNDWELRLIKDKLSDAPTVDRPFDIGEPYTAVRTNLKVAVKYYKTTTENNVMRFPVFEGVIK